MDKSKLFTKWTLRYLVHVILCAAAMMAVYLIALRICSTRVWYPEDIRYILLKWMQRHAVEIVLVTILIITVADALRMFNRIADGMSQVNASVDKMYSEKNEMIRLPDEFAILQSKMNEVRLQNFANAQAAKEANQRKNDMIMYMAHDLKTPLTSVIGYLSLVNDEPDIPQATKEKYTGIALKKSLRLEELINEFFDITRFNFTHMILNRSTINLSMMLEQMVSEFGQQFAAKGLEPELSIEPQIELSCDADKMARVFDNLLKNIVGYSYPDMPIGITMSQKSNEAGTKLIEIVTTNHGRTIPKEMQEHIFEQFFRMDNSRSSESGGTGLGLAVTKEIIELHGGTIRCESEDEMIRFIIDLPKNNQSVN